MVETPCFHCRVTGSIPGQGTRIAHAAAAAAAAAATAAAAAAAAATAAAAAAAAAKSLQSCPTLCDPIDSSPPGPIPGIL